MADDPLPWVLLPVFCLRNLLERAAAGEDTEELVDEALLDAASREFVL